MGSGFAGLENRSDAVEFGGQAFQGDGQVIVALFTARTTQFITVRTELRHSEFQAGAFQRVAFPSHGLEILLLKRCMQDFEAGKRQSDSVLTGMLPLQNNVDAVLANADLV